jgi:lipoteichoic acid synthase
VLDLGFGTVLILICTPIFLIFSGIHLKTAKIFIYIIATIVLIASLLLNKYYATTHLSLGSDLYGYPVEDIKMIVSTSSDVSVTSFWPLIVFAIILFGMFKFLTTKYKHSLWLGAWLLLALIFSALDSYDKKPIHSNLSFFIKDSIEYLQNTKNPKAADWDKSNPYPLLRDNNQTEDLLGRYFNLKAEKPNIVMIVVEGLGRDFSGDDAEYPGYTPWQIKV